MPAEKAGTFTLFGLGGLDAVSALAEQNSDEFNPIKNTDLLANNQMGVTGLSHKIIFEDKANLLTTLSVSGQFTYIGLDSVMSDSIKRLFFHPDFQKLSWLLQYITQ